MHTMEKTTENTGNEDFLMSVQRRLSGGTKPTGAHCCPVK